MFKVGDVVQLKSGGAPWTVVETKGSVCALTSVSVGGLVQATTAHYKARNLYWGATTPAIRSPK